MQSAASALLCSFVLATTIVTGAGAQTVPQIPKEPSVDYWQPLWMQRELWGPGTMPPGMRARLLRHYTFMHFGIHGDAPRSLLPSPALLAFMIQRPIAVDEYLLWSIAEGGKQFDTEMPAFKATLKREDIWKIIAYMRAGFPDQAKAPQGK